jgi:histidine ammonia-lyase
MFRGERRQSSEVHRQLGWDPLVLRPKEALALMNGTAVMTGLACLAYSRADYLLQLATRITAMNVVALEGNPEHFDERLFAAKPHPGQMQVAAWIRQDLAIDAPTAPLHRLQDRYSLRCAPHVLGVLADSLNWWLTSPTCWIASWRCWWTCATTMACRATCPAPALNGR